MNVTSQSPGTHPPVQYHVYQPHHVLANFGHEVVQGVTTWGLNTGIKNWSLRSGDTSFPECNIIRNGIASLGSLDLQLHIRRKVLKVANMTWIKQLLGRMVSSP